jgi:hypothetical protein
MLNRAKAIFLIGTILKAVKPEEDDNERRELERFVWGCSPPELFCRLIDGCVYWGRLVAETAKARKNKKKGSSPGTNSPRQLK